VSVEDAPDLEELRRRYAEAMVAEQPDLDRVGVLRRRFLARRDALLGVAPKAPVAKAAPPPAPAPPAPPRKWPISPYWLIFGGGYILFRILWSAFSDGYAS
jgi:hypothetical protein